MMILGFEDFSIIFAMLTPLYYTAHVHSIKIAKLEKIEKIEVKEID